MEKTNETDTASEKKIKKKIKIRYWLPWQAKYSWYSYTLLSLKKQKWTGDEKKMMTEKEEPRPNTRRPTEPKRCISLMPVYHIHTLLRLIPWFASWESFVAPHLT